MVPFGTDAELFSNSICLIGIMLAVVPVVCEFAFYNFLLSPSGPLRVFFCHFDVCLCFPDSRRSSPRSTFNANLDYNFKISKLLCVGCPGGQMFLTAQYNSCTPFSVKDINNLILISSLAPILQWFLSFVFLIHLPLVISFPNGLRH